MKINTHISILALFLTLTACGTTSRQLPNPENYDTPLLLKKAQVSTWKCHKLDKKAADYYITAIKTRVRRNNLRKQIKHKGESRKKREQINDMRVLYGLSLVNYKTLRTEYKGRCRQEVKEIKKIRTYMPLDLIPEFEAIG